MPLESVLEEIDINQSEGIFDVPDRIKTDRLLKRWIDKFIPQSDYIPLVVEDEIYSVHSIQNKLGLTTNEILRKLISSELLRYDQRISSISPINTLSLAQIISLGYQKPIEEILLSEEYLQSNEFKSSMSSTQRVRTICNAYEGTRWFENLRKHVHKVSEKPLTIYSWQRISRHGLMDLFLIGDGNGTSLRRLTSKGIIISKKQSGFKKSSMDNLIDNLALAELIANLYRVDRKETYSEDMSYINYLAENFLNNRFSPYIKKRGIKPRKKYTVREASEITGRSTGSLRLGATRKRIHHIGKRDIQTLGLDIAIYALKGTQKPKFTLKEFAELFGVDNLDKRKLLINQSPNRTYSRGHYVFPIYDLVTIRAIELFFSGWTSPQSTKKIKEEINCKFGNEILLISESAIRSYLQSYKLSEFTEECRQHIEDELSSSKHLGNGKYESLDLMFKLKEDKIISIAMR